MCNMWKGRTVIRHITRSHMHISTSQRLERVNKRYDAKVKKLSS